MPFHRIPRGRLHEDITAIEREHEVIVSTNVDPDDSGYVLVFTRWCIHEPFEKRMSVQRTTSEHRYAGGGVPS